MHLDVELMGKDNINNKNIISIYINEDHSLHLYFVQPEDNNKLSQTVDQKSCFFVFCKILLSCVKLSCFGN